jgi:acetyl-CoA acetyltransferase
MVIDELALRQERRAVVALCGAAGLAVAMVFERD